MAAGALVRMLRDRQFARYQTWLETNQNFPRDWWAAAGAAADDPAAAAVLSSTRLPAGGPDQRRAVT